MRGYLWPKWSLKRGTIVCLLVGVGLIVSSHTVLLWFSNNSCILIIMSSESVLYYDAPILLGILGSNTWPKITFSSYISAICSSRFYHIQDLQCICSYLDLDSAKLLANTLVSSSIIASQFCLVFAETDLTKLQRAQHRLARVVTKSLPFNCSVPLLHSLYWLAVKFGVEFKIHLLTYKTPWKATHLSSFHACHITLIRVTNNKTKESVRQSLGSPTQAQGHFILVPLHFGRTYHYLSFWLPQLQSAGNVSNISLWLGLPL